MRTLCGPALAGVLVLATASGARAQTAAVGAAPGGYPYYQAPAPVYSRNYAFKDEPLMSINRSYLGYSNLTDTGPGSLSPYGATGSTAARTYVPAPASAPVRRGFFGLFGRRRAYRY